MAATADEPRPLRSSPDPGDGGRDLAVAEPRRSLWRGLISLGILVALVVGLLLAVPGLHGVAERVSNMQLGWLLGGVGLEILSCVGYVVAFPRCSTARRFASAPGSP